MKFFVVLLISISLIATPAGSAAFETDQYNLPPASLADIGDEVSEYVEDNLRTAVARINADIDKSANCLEKKAKGCDSAVGERKKLGYLRSSEAIADEIFRLIGDGNLFNTKFGNWMRSHRFRGQPDRYKTNLSESIYVLNPADYLTISPTVRLYDAEFGIDKLEHLFQQGYKYYKIQRESVAKGASANKAVETAIKWGQRTERTYFGLLVSGVYSNADLYANFAGMRFYQGLTTPVRLGESERPPTVVLSDGKWTINTGDLRKNLLKPFLTDHMNEALNPSTFRLTLVRSIRRAVKKYACADWQKAYPDLTAADLARRSHALNLWNGEDYGFTKKGHFVTIAETCFEGERMSN